MNTRNKSTYMQDVIAKKIFTSKNVGKRLAAAIISEVTNVDEQELFENLEYVHPEVGSKVSIVNSETDISLENGNKYFNIEINKSKGKYTDVKNEGYICQLFLRQLPNSKEYKSLKPITQINIDEYDYFKSDKLIYHCMIMETELHIIENRNIEIYHLNIPKLEKMSYTEIKEERLNRILYLFACEDEEKLDKLYEGDKLMKKVKEEIDKIIKDMDWMSMYYSQDEIDKTNREDAIKEGKELGIQEGREKGIREGRKEGEYFKSIEIAKNMISSDFDINTISKITGLNKEEIEKLK